MAIKRGTNVGTQGADLDNFITNLAAAVEANQIASDADAYATLRSPYAKKISGIQGAITTGLSGTGEEGADLSTPLGKLQFQTAAISPTDEIIRGLEKAAWGYRQQVAPRLIAVQDVASPIYRGANPGILSNVIRDIASFSPFISNTPLYNKAIQDARTPLYPNPEDPNNEDYFVPRIKSPGRSLVLSIAHLTPGQQGAEKLDWTNGKEVDDYFRQGLPRFISGGADFFFNWLDPAIGGIGAASKGKKILSTRPVTSKNVGRMHAELEAARNPNLLNSWKPLLDKIEEVSNPETFNPSVLRNFAVVGDNTKVLVDAQILGGRDLVIDTLKVSIDNGAGDSIEKLATNSRTIAAEIKHLVQQEEKINGYLLSLLDPNVVTPPLFSTRGLREYWLDAPAMGDDLAEGYKRLASYLQDDVSKALSEEIRSKSALADVYLEMTGVAGTSLNQTVPITALRKFAERRAVTAQSADDAYWGIESTYETGSRVGYWVNPSGRLREAPRGMAEFSGTAASRSHREIAARVRDIARVTGMSAIEQRGLYNNYEMLGTRSEMFGYADELLVRSQIDITAKHVPSAATLTPAQKQSFQRVYQSLNLQTTKARGQVIQNARDKNYTITVGQDRIKVPQLEELVNKMANDYALEISNGTRAVATPSEIRFITDEIIKGTPSSTSQIPSIHFAPRASEIEDFVIMHKVELEQLVDDIKTGSLTDNVLDEIIRNPELFTNQVTLSGFKKTGFGAADGAEKFNVAKDNLARMYLGYQNNIWKPMSLIGFVYTGRNLLEGMTRVAMLFAEFHQERGFKYSDMLTDYVGSNTRIANRRVNKSEAKAWRDNITEFNNKFDDMTKTMSSQGKAAEDMFLNAQDSVAMSMKGFEEARSVLDNFVASSPNGMKFLNEIKKSTESAFEKSRPTGASEEFIDAIVSGNYKRSWELSVSMTPEQLGINLAYVKNQALDTLNDVSYIVNERNLSATSLSIARQLQISLSHISASTDTAYLGLLERAKTRGELDGYIASARIKPPAKIRQGEGQFEPIKGSGYKVDDSYAENTGQLMRGQVSSAASTSNVILNVRQQIAQTKLNYTAKEELIFPNVVFGKTVTDKPSPIWAEAFADYANNIHHNDALSVKILSARTADESAKLKPELESWLKSRESAAWRNEMKYSADKRPSRPDGKSKYVSILEFKIEELNKLYPIKGANGEDLSGLRQKIIDRNFTNKDSISIPEIDRMPINGVTITKNTRDLGSIGRGWSSFRNSIFKYLGTIPEDNFVRFPFYRTVYRNEARRRFQVLQDAGKNPALYEEQILKVARQEAYKQTMERLYSIERYTDLGQVMQFMSPFYMAGQNSARFYTGAAVRAPQTMLNAIKVWNIPNAMGVVYDEEGKRIAYDTPWTAEDNTIAFGLPTSVAKLLGAEETVASKVSLDVSFQGRIPGVPSLGGGFVDASTVLGMSLISGTVLDPDRWAMKMGLGPNFIGDKVIPFYQSAKENPSDNTLIASSRAMLGYGSQWKPLMAVGSALANKPSLLFMTRQDSIYRSELIKLDRKGGQYTAQEHADAFKRAEAKTLITLFAEGLLGSLPNIVKPKFRNIQQKEKSIINGYIQQYGYEQGILEYGKAYTGEGSVVNAGILASANVSTDNIFGLFSNSESIYNFNRNKDLVSELDFLNPSSNVVGYFMNTGNPSVDFSVTADEYLYTERLNGKNIKSKVLDLTLIPYELQRKAFNNEYYPYANAIDLQQKADAQAGTEESDKFYKELKDQRKVELNAKYPVYALEKSFRKQESVINDIRMMYAFTQDAKYMKTVGKNSKNVTTAELYLYQVRPILVKENKNKTKTTKELDQIKIQFLDDLSAGDPELAKFLQIFFSRDDYTEIDFNDVWTEVKNDS